MVSQQRNKAQLAFVAVQLPGLPARVPMSPIPDPVGWKVSDEFTVPPLPSGGRLGLSACLQHRHRSQRLSTNDEEPDSKAYGPRIASPSSLRKSRPQAQRQDPNTQTGLNIG